MLCHIVALVDRRPFVDDRSSIGRSIVSPGRDWSFWSVNRSNGKRKLEHGSLITKATGSNISIISGSKTLHSK